MEAAVPHQVMHGIAEFARGGPPTPAATDDGNVWVDGFCWLYCGQQWTRVLWLGPVKVAGAQASMYACGPCIRALQEQVWQAILLNDQPDSPRRPTVPAEVERPSGRRSGKHRAPGLLRRG
ncbi:hypothetical protein ACFV0C_23055 [Streptomyces sp. NPDC059568]|uniref:hypothetical protein n=1 Tax=Streptomyces sp. NPDC059568 TaxID=3346868 RepID=UPI00369E91B5